MVQRSLWKLLSYSLAGLQNKESLQEGLGGALYYRKLLEEISKLEGDIIPITVFIDNKSVLRHYSLQEWWMTNVLKLT